MIDDDKKGKWLVPLDSQRGGCSLAEAPKQRNKGVEQLHTEEELYSLSGSN